MPSFPATPILLSDVLRVLCTDNARAGWIVQPNCRDQFAIEQGGGPGHAIHPGWKMSVPVYYHQLIQAAFISTERTFTLCNADLTTIHRTVLSSESGTMSARLSHSLSYSLIASHPRLFVPYESSAGVLWRWSESESDPFKP